MLAFSASLLGMPGAALADVFSVDEPEVEKGAQEVEVNAAVQNGFPVNADPIRYSMELEYTYGVTKWLSLSPLVDFDKPDGDNFHATVAGIESVWFPVEVGKLLTLAWFSEVEWGVHHDETNSATFGPIIQFGHDKASLIFNTYLEKSFGRNHEEGTEFTYQWQAKASVSERLALGIEGFGVVPNIADSPGIDFQEHRIGPVIYYEKELSDERTFAIDGGVLFGLTEATPNVTGKLNASLAF
ncbi:hypothetical protein [Methyloceanibacter sp.]|uniref:hypothetical protein n=1 Tax=Methyloceanibacter sp. TaxID=1965321 RepID=UPI003D6D4F37